MSEYAHPVGWRGAIIGGFLYGAVVSGLTWAIWRAVTLAPVPLFGYAICAWLFVMCFSVVLVIEHEEHRKVKRGLKNLGHETKWG